MTKRLPPPANPAKRRLRTNPRKPPFLFFSLHPEKRPAPSLAGLFSFLIQSLVYCPRQKSPKSRRLTTLHLFCIFPPSFCSLITVCARAKRPPMIMMMFNHLASRQSAPLIRHDARDPLWLTAPEKTPAMTHSLYKQHLHTQIGMEDHVEHFHQDWKNSYAHITYRRHENGQSGTVSYHN